MCKHVAIKIISETEFGQGDSSTLTYAECRDCGAMAPDTMFPTYWDYGFPASIEAVRGVQFYWEKSRDNNMLVENYAKDKERMSAVHFRFIEKKNKK